MEKLRLGIIGAGNIAGRMADTANLVEETCAYAIASRSLEKAEQFAAAHNVQKSYGSYEAMLADPLVDLVYVALPHSHHFAWAKAALLAGKPVLVEKAFTENAKQAEELFAIAREKGLFCGEAMWSRFVPGADVLRGLEASGKIGKVAAVRAELGSNLWHIERLHNPALAGGALLDIGVYNLAAATLVLGDKVEAVESFLQLSEDGVDMQDAITLKMQDGRFALLYVSCISDVAASMQIFGSKGYAIVDNLFDYSTLRIYTAQGELVETVESPVEHNGFEYQLRAAVASVRTGALFSAPMPHEETLRILRITDEIRAKAGMKYPDE